MYKSLLKPLFFKLEPEKAHHLALNLFRIALAIPGYGFFHDKKYVIDKPQFGKKVFGLTFKNQIGLAAGFDKNAEYIPLMARLGFGHIEVGTVTPLAQTGNDKPRLFRLPDDEALINRMGFNNDGVDAMVKNLSSKKTIRTKEKYKIIIGGNIGKNKNTPNEDAWKDYVICFERLFDHVDYFVVNVSSPNTPGLRELQEKGPLKKILNKLQEINQKNTLPKPILLKIAPDLFTEELHDIVEIVKETKLDGIIATNTTIDRNNLKTQKEKIELIGAGGLSGKPLAHKSNDVLWFLRRELGKDFPLIAVGGIANSKDVQEKINRGANLAQIYTGMVYEGQGVVKNILMHM
ncbi:MAG: quinone-dependent dihydroorotate dehydrogenase [Fimbriimonadaceae bacterium]|nr:quinone-dependent dihydroorotate dehydrogenase [Chitinophagales bacterium]